MELSIVIPAYNVELYLAECLESLTNKISESNLNYFEIIVVNDGSKDSTHTIALSYAAKFNFIKVIDKINGGLSDARNVGIEQSIGKYISFIDSDDIIKAGFIDDVLSVIAANNNIDMITFGVHKFYGNPVFNNLPCSWQRVSEDFYCSKPLIACNKIYKKKLFDQVRFPVGKYYEDVWTTPSLILSAQTYIHINNDYYGYRQRQGSITANVDFKYMDILGALEVISNDLPNGFVRNVCVSQFFTLILLSLRLPAGLASKNLDIILEHFCSFALKPYNNKIHERMAFHLFSIFQKKSKWLFLMCRPAVALHLFIKNNRGR